jgi:hypothetical protein
MPVAAKHDEETAGLKRERAEFKLQLAEGDLSRWLPKLKVAKVMPCVAAMAKVEPKAAALQTKLDAFMRGPCE